jgi:predicted NAD-dependent protein-ADP-ribosyltransferase YbiA (DUF1768 family)
MLIVKGQLRLTTVEHEYQALKAERVFDDDIYAAHIRSLLSPKEAKSAGSMAGWVAWMKQRFPQRTKVSLKAEFKEMIKQRWVPISIKVMRELLAQKFDKTINENLWKALLQTGERPLHEVGRGHGIWIKSGGDMLGQLLMQMRAHARAQV